MSRRMFTKDSFWRTCLSIGLATLSSTSAFAVTCTTQAQMNDAARAQIVQSAKQLATRIEANDVQGVKAATIPSVAANFAGIAQSVQAISPGLANATVTIDAVYGLDASDAKTTEDEAQFFCGAADPATHVTFTIPQLPPGRYAFAIAKATGVQKPQRLSMLLQNDSGGWRLAGFFPRPLTAAGHDGLWYWKSAREFAAKKKDWNAYFYYTTATYLLAPVNFLSSTNLDTLIGETDRAKPQGLPGETPMTLSGNGQSYSITSLRTDDALGGLDLVVRYTSGDNSDPAAVRTRTLGMMKALLAQHPELRDGFHGIWAFAEAPNQPPFSLEQTMAEIK